MFRLVLSIFVILMSSFSYGSELTPMAVQFHRGEVSLTMDSPSVFAGRPKFLFVVDDSGSMTPYQTLLSQQAPILSKLAKDANVESVGVITTTRASERGGGIPSPSPKIFDPRSPSFEADLKLALLPGVSGAGFEMPFLTVSEFAKENPAFFKDSDVVIVLITDAEDQSPLTGDELLANLKALTFGHLTTVAAVVPSGTSGPSCPRDDPATKPVRIEDFVQKTHGSVVDLCNPNFSSTAVTQIEKAVSNWITKNGPSYTRIRLPFAPLADTVVVKWGSLVLRPNDAILGWSYDSTTQEIVLGSAIDWSAFVAKIEVTYKSDMTR